MSYLFRDNKQLGTIQAPSIVLEFSDLVERFLIDQPISAHSKTIYRRNLRMFERWMESTGRDFWTLQKADIVAYRESLSGKSDLTVMSYLTAVRKLYGWIESEGIGPNLARHFRTKKARGYRKDCLTVGQLRAVLSGLDRSSLEGIRDYALINLAARTGLRAVEVIRATIGDLRQQGGEAILWVQGKGRDGKDEFVLVVDKALDPLHRYLSARSQAFGSLKDAAPLFASLSRRNLDKPLTVRSVSRIVKNALRQAGIDSRRLTAHSLRHTAVSLAIQGGASLHQAQAMARHQDPKTTLVYFHNLARVKSGAERFIDF